VFLAWFHIPVTVTVTLGTLRNMQGIVHIGLNDKPGTQLFL